MKKAISFLLSAVLAAPILPAFAQDDKKAEEKHKQTRAEKREQRRAERRLRDEERRERRHNKGKTEKD